MFDIFKIIEDQDVEKLRTLLKEEGNNPGLQKAINNQFDKFGQTPIASLFGSLSYESDPKDVEMYDLLVRSGLIDFTAPDKEGITPLIAMCTMEGSLLHSLKNRDIDLSKQPLLKPRYVKERLDYMKKMVDANDFIHAMYTALDKKIFYIVENISEQFPDGGDYNELLNYMFSLNINDEVCETDEDFFARAIKNIAKKTRILDLDEKIFKERKKLFKQLHCMVLSLYSIFHGVCKAESLWVDIATLNNMENNATFICIVAEDSAKQICCEFDLSSDVVNSCDENLLELAISPCNDHLAKVIRGKLLQQLLTLEEFKKQIRAGQIKLPLKLAYDIDSPELFWGMYQRGGKFWPGGEKEIFLLPKHNRFKEKTKKSGKAKKSKKQKPLSFGERVHQIAKKCIAMNGAGVAKLHSKITDFNRLLRGAERNQQKEMQKKKDESDEVFKRLMEEEPKSQSGGRGKKSKRGGRGRKRGKRRRGRGGKKSNQSGSKAVLKEKVLDRSEKPESQSPVAAKQSQKLSEEERKKKVEAAKVYAQRKLLEQKQGKGVESKRPIPKKKKKKRKKKRGKNARRSNDKREKIDKRGKTVVAQKTVLPVKQEPVIVLPVLPGSTAQIEQQLSLSSKKNDEGKQLSKKKSDFAKEIILLKMIVKKCDCFCSLQDCMKFLQIENDLNSKFLQDHQQFTIFDIIFTTKNFDVQDALCKFFVREKLMIDLKTQHNFLEVINEHEKNEENHSKLRNISHKLCFYAGRKLPQLKSNILCQVGLFYHCEFPVSKIVFNNGAQCEQFVFRPGALAAEIGLLKKIIISCDCSRTLDDCMCDLFRGSEKFNGKRRFFDINKYVNSNFVKMFGKHTIFDIIFGTDIPEIQNSLCNLFWCGQLTTHKDSMHNVLHIIDILAVRSKDEQTVREQFAKITNNMYKYLDLNFNGIKQVLLCRLGKIYQEEFELFGSVKRLAREQSRGSESKKACISTEGSQTMRFFGRASHPLKNDIPNVNLV